MWYLLTRLHMHGFAVVLSRVVCSGSKENLLAMFQINFGAYFLFLCTLLPKLGVYSGAGSALHVQVFRSGQRCVKSVETIHIFSHQLNAESFDIGQC